MAEQWQLRKGSTAENEGFVGAEGELTYDTTTKAVHVHDGETTGGALIDTVVAYQLPTSENGYTWYRKYASGWVEQGSCNPNSQNTITLPVTMQDANYTLVHAAGGHTGSGADIVIYITAKSATGFTWAPDRSTKINWYVCGMAA